MGDKEKTRVSVTIYGTEYKLMGSATKSAAYLQTVASHVNEQMHKIAGKAPHLDMIRVAVLAAVNLSDELSQLKESVATLQQEDSRHQQMKEQQLERLTAELEQQKQEGIAKNELLIESKRQRDHIQQELQQLREEHKELQKELKQQLLLAKQETQLDQDIHEKYNALAKEYQKLQTEYNEWIQLIDREDPVS